MISDLHKLRNLTLDPQLVAVLVELVEPLGAATLLEEVCYGQVGSVLWGFIASSHIQFVLSASTL